MIEEKAHELELSNKYKTEFLANMSHELRTPLNSLLILARGFSLNEDGNLTPEQVEEAGVIYDGGRELLTLINDVLDLSKVEAGKVSVTPEDVHLGSLVSKLAKQFEPVAKEAGLPFHVHLDKSLRATMHTDGQRLEQILKNLLSNAFKFTSNGSVTLDIHRTTAGERERISVGTGATIAFSVTDTGIGIDPSKIKDIFEAFQQEDGSTQRYYGGTGLGLTIARKFAGLLGGEIRVESKKAEGSTFTLFLPLIAGPARRADPAAPEEARPALRSVEASPLKDGEAVAAAKEGPGTALENRTVLLVDDDLRNTFALSRLLRGYGADIVLADNGQMALERLEANAAIELVIMDIMMPVMDGYQAIRAIRAHPNWQRLPVIALTARAMPEEQERCMAAGANDCLMKPVEVERLLGLIQAWLRKQDEAA